MPRQRALRGLLEPFAYGEGFQEILAPTSPAAGANLTVSADGRFDSRLIAVRFTLTTSAVVANRVATVDYLTQDGVIYGQDGIALAVTAGSTRVFVGQIRRGQSESAAGTAAFFPLSGPFIEPGYSVRITVASIDVGDTITGVTMVWERLPNSPHGYPEGQVIPPYGLGR